MTTKTTKSKKTTPQVVHRAPSKWALIGESRAALDVSRLLMSMWIPGRFPKAKTPRRVIVLPGFGADDLSTALLRKVLTRAGHHPEVWGLGRNLAGINLKQVPRALSAGWKLDRQAHYRGELGVPALCDRMAQRLREQVKPGAPVTLIGWSLGGYVAREAARDLPNLVSHVITLGSPVHGGPKYTAAAGLFKWRGLDLDLVERETALRAKRPIRAPITAIVSRSDAIVAESAATDDQSPRVRHIDVDVAHMGLCFHPATIRLVLQALDRGE